MSESIAVVVNGTTRELRRGATVQEMLTYLFKRQGGCAVARNGEVIPKSEWARTALSEGDRVEILGAAQGG